MEAKQMKSPDLFKEDTKSSIDDAFRRAGSFPVRGGDVLPIKRKSWYGALDQKQEPAKSR